jgi:two-component system sensor histidine kinase/response regulator
MNYDTAFLVVDDMEGMRRILTSILRQIGMKNIATAVNGSNAWRIMQIQQVDVVISDWNMPVMTGLELLKKIRASVRFANLPVLMMTSEAERYQVQAAIEAGVSEYMIKPFNVSSFETKLKKIIDHGYQIQQPTQPNLASALPIPAILLPNGKGGNDRGNTDIASLVDGIMGDKSKLKSTAGQGREQPTLLVVDDIPDSLDILVALLSDDYTVRAANSGERALKVLGSGSLPDLILLDVMMPDMDGFEVCRHIKANPFTADIPVIFLSTMSESVDVTKGFEAGAVDFITKPAGPPILRARIDTHLKLEASPANSTIEIELIPHQAVIDTAKGGRIDVRISNGGVVPSNMRENFFDKFTTSGKPDGTGIGTFSARLIARTQRGDITMQTSDTNLSTTATVSLPAAPAPPQPQQP